MSQPQTLRWPRVRKESTYTFRAKHDLRGRTAHPEGSGGEHSHGWVVTLIFEHEINPHVGHGRDEFVVDRSWGRRIAELEGANLNEYTAPFPPTSEILALWLLYYWMPALSPNEFNYELAGVRVSKTVDGGEGQHVCEVRRTEGNRKAWINAGGRVV